MKGQYITVAVCFVALLNSCSARSTSLSRRDNQDESLPNETPELLSEDVYEHRKQPEYNEDDLEQDDNLERRDTQGISDQTSAAIVSGFQSYNNPEQLQQLKDILSLEMNNKEKFAQVYSQMNPEQVKKIRELVLRVGQQTGSQELIKFGQCKSPRFSEKQVQTLIGLGEALYERLNTDATVQNRAGLSAGDQTAVFNQMKASIGNQQDFIRRLVNMIEVQLSKAPQIDDGEFAEIKQITAQIKSLSSQVQTQLQEATDLSQLTNMGDQLLKINSLSSRLQNKVSAELLEDKLKEYVNNVQQSTGNKQDNNLIRLHARASVADTETFVTNTQADTPPQKPQFISDIETFLNNAQLFFEKVRRERQQQLQQGSRPYSQYTTEAIRQIQQNPQAASALNYVQQQYPQVANALQNLQQNPAVSDALQQQSSGVVTSTGETNEQTPELLTTQNADGSLTLQAADQTPQEANTAVETSSSVDTSTTS